MRCSSLEEMATRQPSAASARAEANPRPRLAAVTSARRPRSPVSTGDILGAARCPRLGGETRLLAAGGARRSRLEFGPLEGVSAAMRAERAGTEGSGLLRLLHALTEMTVVFFLDEARIGRRLGAHAAFSSC